MTNAIITTNGAQNLPTVLGQGPMRIPTGGKIRAGIKVLTRKAAESPKAKAIYEQGVRENLSFEDIERAIVSRLPELKTPLVPKNVPWFTVRPGDFPDRTIAAQILELYGEDRGDGEKRLYRFPVVFPADSWQTVMPHELVAWGASEKKFWSEYSADGRERYCKCYAPVPMDKRNQRAIRIFGGRKSVLRQENGGRCEPEACQEYQNRQCNLSGRFVFFIPGIKSLAAFELPTNSFYAMNAAIQIFQTIAFMRGGRISGFLDKARTSFFITKKLMEVPHIDDAGRAVRVKHWIIELEAPIDVTALLRTNDDTDAALINAARAAALLGTPGEAGGETQGAEGTAANGEAALRVHANTADAPREAQAAPEPLSREPSQTQATAQASPAQGAPTLEEVSNAAAALGVASERYLQYAAKRWGAGWKVNPNGRRRALDDIESFRDDREGLLTKITAELDDFA